MTRSRRAFDGHSHAPEAFHKHVIVDPRVRLNGDEATAESYFSRLNDSPEGPVVAASAATWTSSSAATTAPGASASAASSARA